MLFKRRTELPWFAKLRELLWPRAGWVRWSIYIRHRVYRLPGTPHAIAAGFACGAAVSITPLIGLHFLIAALFAFFVRGSIVASAIGTIVGNPWTFPFIWVSTYRIGSWMGVGDPLRQAHLFDFTGFFGAMVNAALQADTHFLAERVWPVLYPMFIGSLPAALLVWVAVYVPFRMLIQTYQNRRKEARTRRLRAVHTGDNAP